MWNCTSQDQVSATNRASCVDWIPPVCTALTRSRSSFLLLLVFFSLLIKSNVWAICKYTGKLVLIRPRPPVRRKWCASGVLLLTSVACTARRIIRVGWQEFRLDNRRRRMVPSSHTYSPSRWGHSFAGKHCSATRNGSLF